MPPKELRRLARQLANRKIHASAAQLRGVITPGFYAGSLGQKFSTVTCPGRLSHTFRRVSNNAALAPKCCHHWRPGSTKIPPVPTGDWFKRFSTMTVGGREPRVKVLLTANQVAIGQEIEA